MIVTKNIFGKIKKVEISVQEMDHMLFSTPKYISDSFAEWLTKAIGIEWFEAIEVPAKKEEFKV